MRYGFGLAGDAQKALRADGIRWQLWETAPGAPGRSILVAVALAGVGFVVAASLLVSSPARAGEQEWKVHTLNGIVAESKGDHRGAIRSFTAALAEAESSGADDKRLSTSLARLAAAHQANGDFAEAVALNLRVLAIQERVQGPGSAQVATTLDRLGISYDSMGRLDDAERCFTRAISIRETALGPGHRDVGAAMGRLAGVYTDMGRYAEAERLQLRALAIIEKAVGRDDRALAGPLEELGRLYEKMGRLADAEQPLVRALAIREKGPRPGDRGIGNTLLLMARVLSAQGRYREAEEQLVRARRIFEAASGPAHPSVGIAWNELGNLYHLQGRLDDAESAYDRGLAILEKALGEGHHRVATTLANLATVIMEQGRYAEAELLYRRSLAIDERAWGPDHPSVAGTLTSLAALYETQGRLKEAVDLLGRSLRIQQHALAPDHPDLALTLVRMADAYALRNRFAEARQLLDRAIAILERAFGPEHLKVGKALSHLAVLEARQGRYAEAESLVRRALAIDERAFGLESLEATSDWNNLAGLKRARGQLAEAESLHRRVLATRERVLAPNHPDIALTLNNLGVVFMDQGRPADAARMFQRSLAIRRQVLGDYHPLAASTLRSLAIAEMAMGRFAEAAPLFRRSMAIQERVLPRDDPDFAVTLNVLANAYRIAGRHPEAEALLRRSIAISERAFGADHPRVADAMNSMARLKVAQSERGIAEEYYGRALEIREKALGRDHPATAEIVMDLASLYGEEGRWPEALSFARRATSTLAARQSVNEPSEAASLAERRSASPAYEKHVSLLHAALGSTPEATAEGFEAAQASRASDTADQLARMAARFAAGSDGLASIARARQDMNARIASLDARILRAASVAPKERDGDAEARLRQDLDVARKALLDLDERIGREWPRYLDLTAPRPLPLADAQSLLSPDEALVSWLVTGDGTFLWAVRRDAALFERLDVSRKELTEAVRRLRRGLDLGAAGPRILERPFDVASAHELYRRLLGPAERLLSGARHLLVVPDGALTSLPLAVLVTSPPAGEIREIRDHANVDWLVRRHAITTLPSVGSLRSLRAFAKGAPAPDPFSGFGDPILQGGPGSRGADSDALLSRGLVADTREVRKLSRLPETAHELQTIASLLGSPPDRVHLAEDATETRVKELDLARYRVLAFATHGLMAGDFRGLAEPALVLTPPEEGTEQDDGLLTASEVARLKLNADWVILSACNTAAPDGTPGAEGLSGLAKAFFFAGTRSLLVSHWAVNSEATVSLTTGAFQALGGGAPRAEALRRSMLALMQSTIAPEFAHPALWAPFVVVGEGWDAPAPSAHSMRRGQDGTARP